MPVAHPLSKGGVAHPRSYPTACGRYRRDEGQGSDSPRISVAKFVVFPTLEPAMLIHPSN